MSKHDKATPRPWVTTPKTWKSTTSDYTLTLCGIEQDPAVFGEDDARAISYAAKDYYNIDSANAELIVQAVNCHDDFVLVCKALLLRFDSEVKERGDENAIFPGAALRENLRRVLEKAGEL